MRADEYKIEDQLDLALKTAQRAAYKAGAWLKAKKGQAEIVGQKARRDALLDADLEAEQIIIDILRTQFPEHTILSEETEQEWGPALYKWVVDPLDGSANFQHGSPVFGISICLRVDNRTTLGAIYLPMLDEMFTAWRGRGAWLNEQPISVSGTTHLDDAMIYVGDFAKDGDQHMNAQLIADITRLANAVGRVRMIGTAATDLAYVACGRADALLVHNPYPWDIEMGQLLVREAGGQITRQEDDRGEVFLCSNGIIHEELASIIATERPLLMKS
jgi:myo-inositol-1(or 4)-monophosphatase